MLKGIVLIPDGRGGRVVSGTNAPMYTTAFFEHNEPSHGQEAYERRLALAFEIDQASRVLASSAPDSPASSTTSSSPGTPGKITRVAGPVS
ncbi:hypothetical protein H2203_005697 [Taxawa tesnikishii (nom. ined.)]|nr:hypothetical protein H2203_005697 [Dothideales sp. JES 119]